MGIFWEINEVEILNVVCTCLVIIIDIIYIDKVQVLLLLQVAL